MALGNAVGVIGAGAYGTALACAAARAGRDVVLYVRGAENAAQMQATRTNPKLPGIKRRCADRDRQMILPQPPARTSS